MSPAEFGPSVYAGGAIDFDGRDRRRAMLPVAARRQYRSFGRADEACILSETQAVASPNDVAAPLNSDEAVAPRRGFTGIRRSTAGISRQVGGNWRFLKIPVRFAAVASRY